MKLPTGIIIQARTQSLRLPNKIVLPFYNGECILEIILRRFVEAFPDLPIIVATTSNPKDDRIEAIVSKFPIIKVFRGEESNVIKRFIDAAELNNLDSILRVCSDNVFIDMDLTRALIEMGKYNSLDYISYKLAGDLPVIKSHQGFFTELVSSRALRMVTSLTSEETYIEHVTNYLYTHPEIFKTHLEPAPSLLYNLTGIRLTIDTDADFINSKIIYSKLIKEKAEFTYLNVLRIVQSNENLLISMSEQIKLNSK
jgi:spore coat polysaccharide biosynthesis protein SpsF